MTVQPKAEALAVTAQEMGAEVKGEPGGHTEREGGFDVGSTHRE